MRRWEIVWWVLTGLFLVVQAGQLLGAGPNRETLVLVSELAIAGFLGIVFLFRKTIEEKTRFVKSRFWRFMIVGYLSTVVAETLYIFSKPLHKDWIIDLVLTAPWYVLWLALWYKVYSENDFSLKDVFFLGGFHGFVLEGVLSGFFFANPVLALLALPLFSSIYGCFLLVPFVVLENEFREKRKSVSTKDKIRWSLLPLVAYVPGAIWIFALTLAFGLTLH